ncbi:MAG: T9SS type A sorting domain-containing protein [Candidatus Zixiibacteriota bacterium]|nr:MAG: T9SS type A sorting domain-containing protein [candidate division Zixibacteria bacterium]
MPGAVGRYCIIPLLLVFTGGQGAARSPLDITRLDDSSIDEASVRDPLDDADIPWPTKYGVQQTGSVDVSFDCYGLFGMGATPWYPSIPDWPSASFETPPGSGKEYLWMGALWIGGVVGGDTLVSHGLNGWGYIVGREFFPPTHPYGSVTGFDYPSDEAMRAIFTDTITQYVERDFFGRPHVPLNLRVVNRSHIWRAPEYQDFVIYDLVMTNLGSQDIEQGYIGIYVDGDVGHESKDYFWTDDVAGGLRDQGIAYVIDADGDPVGGDYDSTTSVRKVLALSLLAASQPVQDTNFNWWVNRFGVNVDFGPRQLGTSEDPFFDFQTGTLGTPEGDRNKYYLLKHREWDYDQVLTAIIPPDDPQWCYPPQDMAADLADGYDVKIVLSFGPFDIAPDSSVRVLYAMSTADEVHELIWNIYNLPDNPLGYVRNLNFDGLIANIARAGALADSLLNPMLPATGLEVVTESWDSVVIEWDPFTFSEVEGYDIYLAEIPEDSLPYPGLVPPWYQPANLGPIASVGPTYRHKLDNLDPGKFYFLSIAPRSQAGIGQLSEPECAVQRGRLEPPVVQEDYEYFISGETVTIQWEDATGCEVDHYTLYRFPDEEALQDMYRPFYTKTAPGEAIEPADTFYIGDDTYYYYAMEPYVTVEPDVNAFEVVSPTNGEYYVLTVTDEEGFESEFSSPLQLLEVYPQTRDILLITNLGNSYFGVYDSVRAFYESVLADYDYAVYSVLDTVADYYCDPSQPGCINWADFTRFRLTIFDGEKYDNLMTQKAEENVHTFAKYLLSGGRLAYFGCLNGMNYFDGYESCYYLQNDWFVNRFFGIDSLYFQHYRYYFYNELPIDSDTCFGFAAAEPCAADLPVLAFDSLGGAISPFVRNLWQDQTPPSVSTFHVNDNAELLYRYRSRYPVSSRLEGDPVGVRLTTGEFETYLFGFHLWYIERESARELVDYLFEGSPTDERDAAPAALPARFALRQNYPNPFNPATRITFDLPRAGEVTLEIFNILGRRVRVLLDGVPLEAGTHVAEWNGTAPDGRPVSSGIYFYRIRYGQNHYSRKMMLVR